MKKQVLEASSETVRRDSHKEKRLKENAAAESESPVSVVGIGASAGGLEAIQELLRKLPDNTGLAYVIIQHLAPDYKSMLSEILCKYTMMPVMQVENAQKLERNTVYLIPPKYNMEVSKGHLVLHEHLRTRVINHPIDIFLRSLAKEYETHAIAVILSGTGSDGTNGARSIKEQGGVILVQQPETAKFDGMPKSALQTGFVDMSLPPEGIADELTHIALTLGKEPAGMTDEELLNKIYSILKKASNVNYTYYKQTTVTRRIERRMVVNHIQSLYEYVNYLLTNNDEASILAKDVLIGVTSFFRDAECFEMLKQRVIKPLVESHAKGVPIRAWVAGCSTGEEAYSIAMLFTEAMEETGCHAQVKIFATDLDKDAVITAGKGQYGENIIEDISAQRLSRFFTKKNNSYIVSRELRKLVVFAPQNVFQDPPFGKLDLISCRNMLIYFQNNLQKDLFAIFHMALNDGGYLFLGRSEAISGCGDIYIPLCPNEKIFTHNASGHAPKELSIHYHIPSVDTDLTGFAPVAESHEADDAEADLHLKVLEDFMPPCLLIDEQNTIRHIFGDCNNYLSFSAGKGVMNLFTMLAEDLRIAVSTALKAARDGNRRVSYASVPVRGTQRNATISLVVSPIQESSAKDTQYFAVVLMEQGSQAVPLNAEAYHVNEAASRRIRDLENDLARSQSDLKKTVSELETVNEELQATNEELLTSNEELQSSNEELQSVNEELYTVNAEYQEKLSEVTALNNDISNFLSSTLVGVIFLDEKFQIRRFTEYVSKEFTVMDQDIGRPIRFMSYNFVNVDLVSLCERVASQLSPVETNVESVAGKNYFMRIAPYRTSEKKIVGLVITFVNTTPESEDARALGDIKSELQRSKIENIEKDSFLSRISHDVRTPLNAILGTTQLMRLDKGRSAADMDQFQTIETNVEYLLGIFNDILETSMINAGKITINPEPTSEYKFLEEILPIVAASAEKKGITLADSLGRQTKRVLMIDANHVRRILVNIISNAIRYTPAGGKVDFIVNSRKLPGGKIRHEYTVTDNGAGMSPEFQKKMYEPFMQENAIYAPAHGAGAGTGLGLYIVHKLVDAMDGTISCTSAVGQGTTFRITLDYELCSAPASQQNEIQAGSLAGKHLLICEDQQINADIAINMLSYFGAEADAARNGREGVLKFHQSPVGYYDAILMDIRMPVMDGREATVAIREKDRPDAKTIPIIAMTGDVYDDDRADFMHAGITDCIYKPVNIDELYRILSRYLLDQKS